MKRITSIIFTFLAAFGIAQAVTVQKVHLKNGSVLEGFIQSQDGSGKLTIHTDKATICVNSDQVQVFERKVKENTLDKAWQDWAEKHDAYEGSGDDRKLMLNNLTFKESNADSIYSETKDFEDYLLNKLHSVSNVKVLENGVTVKYLELNPNDYVVSWDEIETIKADRRDKTALSGINRIYALKNGRTYEGQYAGETNNTLSLYMPGGMVQSFEVDDVVKYTFRPINPAQDIFEQSELIDVIKTRNGGIIRGITLEQNYSGKKDSENIFLVQTETGTIQTIKVSDIRELQKEENPKYSPRFDIMLKEGDIVINRNNATFVKVQEEGDLLTMDSAENQVVVERDAKGAANVVVEYRIKGNANVEAFQLVKVTKTKVKRKEIYNVSYRDLVNAKVHPAKIETSVNNTTRAEYNIYNSGSYALYDAVGKRAVTFIVK